MRMMVGLTSPTLRTATTNERRFVDLPNPGREVGVMLDASAQHAGRTGRETLTIAQRMMGVPASRVAELLAMVSLTATEADRRVGNYSLGMRQRLGIADDIVRIGQGRIVCQGSKTELLQAAGTVVRSPDSARLHRALVAAGIAATESGDGAFRTGAGITEVGRAAHKEGVLLTELRTSDSGGLEDMFLELTADTQRERTAA
jgi:ABC-2 type transport system ATP-binding protein